MPRQGVLRLDGRTFVAVVRYGDIVVWHYTFADHWFKVNAATDLDGAFVETPKGGAPVDLQLRHRHPNGAQGDAVLVVDLFLDVLAAAMASPRGCATNGSSTRHPAWLV
jgi:hypothetical protein